MIHGKKIFSIFLLSINAMSVGFDTLTDLQNYAAKYIEYPKSDDNYWVDPNYTSYHHAINPSLLTEMLRAAHLQKNNGWDIKIFENQNQMFAPKLHVPLAHL